MRNRQVLLLLLEYIVTSECLKGIRTGFNLHQNDKSDPRPPATKNIIAYVDDIVVRMKRITLQISKKPSPI
jgi:hypothetical protein